MRKLSRRQAIRLALLGGIAVGLAQIYAGREALRYAPGIVRGQWLRLVGGKAVVAVVRCPTYADATQAVRAAWDLAGGPPLAGRRVVLKPNLVDYLPDRPVHTAPEILEAAVDYLSSKGVAEVVVADGPCFNRDSDQLLADSGLGEMLRRRGVPFVDLNYDDLDEVPLRGNYGNLKRLYLPRAVTRADVLVSVPKMKTHHWTGVSLGMKNLFGVVPGVKYGWPKNSLHWNGITTSILALYETLRPQFALVDGVVGLEGDGPIHGSARPTGVVVAGTDLVAVDATAARVMGVDPARIAHLRVAGLLGLGRLAEAQIAVRGIPIAEVVQRYLPPPEIPT